MENVNEFELKKGNDLQNAFEEFGYRFNEFGQLRHITTGAAYEFNVKEEDHAFNQRRYEALGDLVTDYVYDLLEKECGLKKMTVPLDAHGGEPTTFIFHSDDAFTNEKIVILIHGTGVVRAGQWARRLIINDSLNSGTQIPFIKHAKGLGYGVVVFNTNDNKITVKGGFRSIRGSECAENHANYVWKNIIIPKVTAKYIAILAHSYGGCVTINLCRSFPESFQKRVFAIAFTDSCHNFVSQDLTAPNIEWFHKVARNWVVSYSNLDSPLSPAANQEIECVSAGTQRHDLTSWMSFSSIFEFIDAKYKKKLTENEM